MTDFIENVRTCLLNQNASGRVNNQQKARKLLFEKITPQDHGKIKELKAELSAASEVFVPDEWHKNIYHNDTGTHIIPSVFKKWLTRIKSAFVVRTGSIDDVSAFVKWANKTNMSFTIRGAGSWPFGGSIPIDNDVILDLSYLNFQKLYKDEGLLAFGAGLLFPEAREYLKKNNCTLRQEITNPHSGTIAGWIVTGGLGLGSYKYGPVKESVKMLLVVQPDGNLVTLESGQEEFDLFFGSEGQLGIVVGGALQIRNESFVTKPYAFSFEKTEDVNEYLEKLQELQIKPTSVIYFDKSYTLETAGIERKKLEKESREALDWNDPKRFSEHQEDKNIAAELSACEHILVMHFDEQEDFQHALKTRLFSASGEQIRIGKLVFRQLSTTLSHKLWDHRFLPVQMKQNGPSMLVSETIMPFKSFVAYQDMIRPTMHRLLGVDIKTEAHLLRDNRMLIQSIFLADTRILRHKVYFAFVPFMTEMALFFGAVPYGFGIWNLPFFKRWREANKSLFKKLSTYKKTVDPKALINRAKFINWRSKTFLFRVFTRLTPVFNHFIINTVHKRQQGKRFSFSYPFEWILWNINGFVLPRFAKAGLKKPEKPLDDFIAPCAECDSCEHVCPTSDVFGLYGPATPITRRKTAQRLVEGESISKEEALGFMACTRCDNCVRVCPTDIPLTLIFDMVEQDNRFLRALNLNPREKEDYLDRFWQIMKESPLYKDYTRADQKEQRSHLQHGLKIVYPRGFEYGQLFIDPKTCIHCGMCSDENACMYGARHGKPRQIPELLDLNCALCNACVNYCPQNKSAQEERDVLNSFIYNATDLEEKKYWLNRQNRIHDTTKVHRSNQLTEMADRYVTEDIIMEIDKEASSGQIPVSGMGQGDRHMGIGFDAERFAHFHIVGPAQNRLHEGDPEEELSVILGKRDSYCRFDKNGKLISNNHANLKLMTPILYNALRLESNGIAELAMIKVAEEQKSLVVIDINRIIQNYNTFLREGVYSRLPEVIVPKIGPELIEQIQTNPRTNRNLLTDLWRMPAFEITWHEDLSRTISYILDSVKASGRKRPLIAGYLEVFEQDIIGSLSPSTVIKEKITHFLNENIDILHIHGRRNKEDYFVTSNAIRAIHHYLMRIGRRHEVSLIASGGIRLASDSQKTIQRGAEATLIDFAALLALDPTAYKAIKEDKATTEKLLSLNLEKAIKRLHNQAESRKVQILEVLGASGFKDIKKTVGEEGRLIDFHQVENKLQRSVFEDAEWIGKYDSVNSSLIENERIPEESIRRYSELKNKIIPLNIPHNFYLLGQTNQTLYKRDYVWPGMLIENMGRMAAGDLSMLDFRNNKQTGLLGDGFDVMKILYNKDPMDVTEDELEEVVTALPLDKDLVLEAPWMFGGKSVGSIGLDTWRAHVVASRELGIQFDTGEGGYPTSIFLNSKGEPVFFNENEIELIGPLFENGKTYTIKEIREKLAAKNISEATHPAIYEKIKLYPSLKPITFMVIIGKEDEPFISTELKTGLFGVSKQTIRKARRVVIAYSQGAKMGIGGHILSQKVNKLVSYLRGVDGSEVLQTTALEKLMDRLTRFEKTIQNPMTELAKDSLTVLDKTLASGEISDELKETIFKLQDKAYELHAAGSIDDIDFENIISSSEEIIRHSYSSIISPFPFHNCYSIEDVKAFIDVVHMINPGAVVSVKVSPSSDIEFIAAGLARIAKDNTDEMMQARFGEEAVKNPSDEQREYAIKHGMKIEVWLDGPRGGTGASPNIIKGQMGMHIEYAVPLIHNRLVRDGLRNNVKFMVSGGIRTYEDVIKTVALGADGVIWGTACLVTVGCDRNRNCHDGCSRGIATSNLTMQKLRDVESNTQQMINAFIMMQMQVIRALAALGMKDMRELRGRFDKIHWLGLKERVDHRFRIDKEIQKAIRKDEELFIKRAEHATGQSNCGVAAINGTEPIPGYILDQALDAMRNRGMDGVGVAKTLCFPKNPNDYAYSIMVKGVNQQEIEENLRLQWQTTGTEYSEEKLREESRKLTVYLRSQIIEKIKKVFLDPFFEYAGETRVEMVRDLYKWDENGKEMDYRQFGNEQTDPGDIFRFFVRA
ncbi:MAG: FAD-binding protein, partial [Calditrichaeota bacterium]|nr:FAD-binding protein [Calditrichota bacterium]